MTCHIHLDTVGGIAGDMFVACMLDAFPALLEECMQDLSDSGVLQHVSATLTPGKSHGLAVQRFDINCTSTEPCATGTYRDLKQWLENCELAHLVKQRALSILHLLADAESQAHGVALENVHFHEVADWDSLADIVAAASVIERSGVGHWSCSALPLGSGLVDTAHGKLPIPAPATVHLLRDLKVCDDGEAGERVTPTGAAIVRHLWLVRKNRHTDFITKANGICRSTGMGAGQRSLETRPNIVRCMHIDLVEPSVSNSMLKNQSSAQSWQCLLDEVDELRFNIDDMTPEELATSMGYIRGSEGVLDATCTVSMGKKQRAMFDICILCTPGFEGSVSETCFIQTTTLGIRIQRIRRRILQRNSYSINDEHGDATVKQVCRPDANSAKVESDDLQDLPTLAQRRARAIRLLSESQS